MSEPTSSRATAIEAARTAPSLDFFDNYPVRFVQPMTKHCSICSKRDEWGIDIGPADDLCKRCYLRAESVVRTGRAEGEPETAPPAGPTTAVLVDGVLWESQEAYEAAQAEAEPETGDEAGGDEPPAETPEVPQYDSEGNYTEPETATAAEGEPETAAPSDETEPAPAAEPQAEPAAPSARRTQRARTRPSAK